MNSADYAVARCLSVCLSVRPSLRHTPVLCVNGYTYPEYTKRDGNIPTGTTLTGAPNAKGVWKNHDLRPISGFVSELMQDRAIVTMEGE